MRRLEYYVKNNKVIQFVFKHSFSIIMRVISFFIPIKKNLILFTGHNGGINDSPRLIYEFLIKQKERNYIIIWGVNKSNIDVRQHIKTVQINSLRYFFISMRAKYWVASVNIERGLNYKKRKQVYLNTWHGIPIKAIGNDVRGRRDFNFSKVNYFIVSSDYEVPIYVRAFRVKEESILKVGLPRNEELLGFNEKSHIDELRALFKIPFNKKVILYAPTWRESEDSGNSYVIQPPINLDIWRESLASNYVLLFRLHPYTEKALNIQFDDFCINVSSHNNLNELILLSDILITDYSSIVFDYAITGKPMFCFAYDYDQYCKSRGLYLDLKDEFPGGVIYDENTLLHRLTTGNFTDIMIDVKNFSQKYNVYFSDPIKTCLDKLLSE